MRAVLALKSLLLVIIWTLWLARSLHALHHRGPINTVTGRDYEDIRIIWVHIDLPPWKFSSPFPFPSSFKFLQTVIATTIISWGTRFTFHDCNSFAHEKLLFVSVNWRTPPNKHFLCHPVLQNILSEQQLTLEIFIINKSLPFYCLELHRIMAFVSLNAFVHHTKLHRFRLQLKVCWDKPILRYAQ